MDAPDAEAQLRAELHATLEELYPEIAGATVLDERWILAADCPAFEVGAWQSRPTTTTTDPRLVLAGDHVRLPVPAALMEGAATSGFLAANSLLRYLGVAGVAVDSVPLRGILSGAAALGRRANVGPFRSRAA
jgi:isorenieratene synthase